MLSGAWAADQAALRAPDALAALDIDLVLGSKAVSVDVRKQEVVVSGGRRLPYGDLVIATGLAPRRLGAFDGLAGAHVLRTLDDVARLRGELLAAERLIVLGAGVLGCEIAATGRQLGLGVTVVDPAPVPMGAQVGPEIGALLAELHRANGVEVLTGTKAEAPVVTNGRITEVLTSAGLVTADGTAG